jgi:Flp pilus assembly protein TadG
LTASKNRGRRQGQAQIEFLLVIVLFLLTLFGAFEFCRLLLSYTTLANASRVAMRYASVHGSSNGAGYVTTAAEIEGIVRDFTHGSLIDPALVTVTTSWPQSGSDAPGAPVVVEVSYPYRPFVLLPMETALNASVEGIVTY